MSYDDVLNRTPMQIAALLTEDSTPPGLLRPVDLDIAIERLREFYGR